MATAVDAFKQDYVAVDEGTTDTVTISSSHWGPHHGPQGDVLFGANGFEFEGYTYETDIRLYQKPHVTKVIRNLPVDMADAIKEYYLSL